MGKNFPELLREARLKAKLTQDDLASLISDYLGTFGSPVGATIATWESTDPRKHSRPSVHDRKTLRALIASLVKAGGLAALIDADELLLAGGYAPLYSDEKDEIFPSSPVESNRKPIDNDKGGGGNEDEELPDSDSVTGQLPLSSPFYISRKMDKFALTAMHWQGSTVTIKGPRQFGKSSLLVRLCHEAETVGKRSVCLNFAEIGGDALADPTVFYPRFCASVAHQLDMDDRSNDFFTPSLGSVQCCGLYFENYLLKELGSSFLLAIDEADKIIDCTFRDDFFGMLRTKGISISIQRGRGH